MPEKLTLKQVIRRLKGRSREAKRNAVVSGIARDINLGRAEAFQFAIDELRELRKRDKRRSSDA